MRAALEVEIDPRPVLNLAYYVAEDTNIWCDITCQAFQIMVLEYFASLNMP